MIVPGHICLVSYANDEEWHHERLMCYPVGPGSWYVLTPDGDFYEEDAADYASQTVITAQPGYPRGVLQVVSFKDVWELDDMKREILRGRRAARATMGRVGLVRPERSPERGVDYYGAPFDLEEEGVASRVSRQLFGGPGSHRPGAPVRAGADAIVERAGRGRAGYLPAPAEIDGEALSDGEAADTGSVWFTREVVGGLPVNSEMVLEGQFKVLGDRALMEVPEGGVMVLGRSRQGVDALMMLLLLLLLWM